jgi:ABC-type branched-subunit amino acid transport system ATPase component
MAADSTSASLALAVSKLLSFVRELAQGANMIIIDEPTEGVQFENVVRMADLILSHKQAGMSFLVVEQNLTLVERIADRIVIMDHGEIVLSGTSAEIAREDILSHLTV